jgi:hypothetical protein
MATAFSRSLHGTAPRYLSSEVHHLADNASVEKPPKADLDL